MSIKGVLSSSPSSLAAVRRPPVPRLMVPFCGESSRLSRSSETRRETQQLLSPLSRFHFPPPPFFFLTPLCSNRRQPGKGRRPPLMNNTVSHSPNKGQRVFWFCQVPAIGLILPGRDLDRGEQRRRKRIFSS